MSVRSLDGGAEIGPRPFLVGSLEEDLWAGLV